MGGFRLGILITDTQQCPNDCILLNEMQLILRFFNLIFININVHFSGKFVVHSLDKTAILDSKTVFLISPRFEVDGLALGICEVSLSSHHLSNLCRISWSAIK